MNRWAKKFTLSLVALMSLSALAGGRFESLQAPFPEKPNLEMSPGDLCDRPDSHRYPERIPYCNRSVSSRTKWEIIDEYDNELGFEIRETGRHNFKIDHHIPLCMGGSNDVENLWPQHRSIYELTDPLEPELCGRVASGSMTQAEAVELIRHAKQNPHEAPAILREVMRGNHDSRR